jgi:hypothetical protein
MAKHGFAKILHGLRNHLHELTGSQLKVWLCHRLHEDKNATAFPSIHTIAKETGLDPTTVGTAHTWLRANGWLKTLSYRSAESGRFAVPVARCTYPWLKQETPPSMGNPVSVESTVHGFSVDGSTVDGFDPIEVDTPKEAASAVPLPQPIQDPEVFRPTGGNQPINQPIKKKPSASPQAPPFSDELQNPQGLGLKPNKEQEQNQTGEEEEWMEDVKLVFPHAGALGSMHRKMWFEIMDRIRVSMPQELIRSGRSVPIPNPIAFSMDMVVWNLDHIPESGQNAGMRIRGLKNLHTAVMKADPDNGIIAQTLYHDPDSCRKCLAKQKQEDKKNAEFVKQQEVIYGKGYATSSKPQPDPNVMNAECRWKECKKSFHSDDPNPNHHFCSADCREKFRAREQELMEKYNPNPRAKGNPFRAFEGLADEAMDG